MNNNMHTLERKLMNDNDNDNAAAITASNPRNPYA